MYVPRRLSISALQRALSGAASRGDCPKTPVPATPVRQVGRPAGQAPRGDHSPPNYTFGQEIAVGSPTLSPITEARSSSTVDWAPRTTAPSYPKSPSGTTTWCSNGLQANDAVDFPQAWETSACPRWTAPGGRSLDDRPGVDSVHGAAVEETVSIGHFAEVAALGYGGCPAAACVLYLRFLRMRRGRAVCEIRPVRQPGIGICDTVGRRSAYGEPGPDQ